MLQFVFLHHKINDNDGIQANGSKTKSQLVCVLSYWMLGFALSCNKIKENFKTFF